MQNLYRQCLNLAVMFRYAKDAELAKEIQAKNFPISETQGVQRFFFDGQLWLRLVEMKKRGASATYWQQTDPEDSYHWGALLYRIREDVENLRHSDIFVDGWCYWGSGQPAVLLEASVLQVLEIVYKNGPMSEWPQRRET